MKHFFSLLFVIAILNACQSTPETSTNDIMEQEVKNFFFMNDSMKVKTHITDTIFRSELLEQEKDLDYKISVTQHNIDTLALYVHLWENNLFDLMDSNANQCEIDHAKLLFNSYQLSQKEFMIEKMNYMNTRRIYLGLKRFSNDSIMGYETDVTYFLTDTDSSTLHVLMNANYKIVD